MCYGLKILERGELLTMSTIRKVAGFFAAALLISTLSSAELPFVSNNKVFGLTNVGNNNVSAELSSPAFGHIYYEYDEVPLNLKVDAVSGLSEKFTVNLSITNLKNEQVFSEIRELYFNADGKYNDIFVINMSDSEEQYGIFTANLKITDVATQKTVNVSERFSVINSAENAEPNYNMGICQHFDRTDKDKDDVRGVADDFLYLLKRGGYYIQRQDFRWDRYEDERGFIMPEYYKTFMNSVNKNGLSPYFILAYGHSMYYEYEDDGMTIKYKTPITQWQLDAWGDYCYNAAYDTKAYGAQTFEVWNEYNMDGSTFNPDRGTPQNYVNLLKTAYTNVKKVNSNAKVYAISAAYVTSGYTYTTYEWIEEVLKLLKNEKDKTGKTYMDAISFHIYTNYNIPETARKDKIIQNVRNIMSDYGFGDLELILTETGYSSGAYRNADLPLRDNPDKIRELKINQAKYEIRDYAIMYDVIDKVIWYSSIDMEHLSDDAVTNEFESNLGHIHKKNRDVPYEAKPVYAAISNWNTLLANSTLLSKNINDNGSDNVYDDIYDYTFRGKDGRKIHMIWSALENTEYSLNVAYNNPTIYDMYGNFERLTSKNGAITINVTDEPVYIDEGKGVETIFMQNGTEIKKIKNKTDDVSVSVSISPNVLDNLSEVIAIAISYENGIIKAVETDILSKTKCSASLTVAGGEKICCYVWDKDVLKPITEKSYISE